jgi:hypothetical protein
MSFTLADFQAAAEAKYGGLVIDDAPGGPLTIRNAMAVSDNGERVALKAAIAKVNDLQQPTDGEQDAGAELDNLPELQAAVVELLAVLSTRPDDLRTYLGGQPLTVVVAVKDAWEAASDPKAA